MNNNIFLAKKNLLQRTPQCRFGNRIGTEGGSPVVARPSVSFRAGNLPVARVRKELTEKTQEYY